MDNTSLLNAPLRSVAPPVHAPATSTPTTTATTTATSPTGFSVRWARHLDEVRAAQRLRHAVFAGEMGARLRTPIPGHDIDLFDDHCEHLLVTPLHSDEVIGTYRVLTPAQARRVGCTYSDTEFDLTRLRAVRERMVELGRSCVHPEHRNGGVILALWGALGDFMRRNALDVMIGCASVPMHLDGRYAAGLWQQLQATHLAPIDWRVRPRLPLPIDRIAPAPGVQPPPLVKGYLRLGAKLMGPPAWDPDFNTADLPMVMRLEDLAPRYRKHLLGV